MKARYRGVRTITKRCPECNADVTYRKRRGVKRFKPLWQECQECGELVRF